MANPNIEHIHSSVSGNEPTPRRFWLAPLIALLLVILVGGTIFSVLTYEAGVRESIRVSESIAYAKYIELKALVDIDTYYEGISIDNIALGGKTRAEAAELVHAHQQSIADAVAIKLKIDDSEKVLAAADIGFSDDADAVLEQAWQIGRTSNLQTDVEQVYERYAVIQQLAQEPVDFTINETFSQDAVAEKVKAFVDPLQITAKPATATGFDTATGSFHLDEQVIGHKIDQEAYLNRVFEQLQSGNFQADITSESEVIKVGMTAAEMRGNLALVATATTLASKVDPPRDNNLLKACEYLNGTIVQPGDTFSFNKAVGKRTAERGFQEAGAISDGTLGKEFGGGVCQVNTTVMQAAMKSDYKLVERYPHSWPSSYTKVGLDATVTWGGADFKFKNNSDYPVAIVASYVKPKLIIKVYGRKLEDGLTISLKSVHEGYVPVEAAVRRPNSSLAPGQVVVVRAQHIGQNATAYKVYQKNGAVVKEVVLFKSYYKPIQGIFDVGPKAVVAAPSAAISAAAGLND